MAKYVLSKVLLMGVLVMVSAYAAAAGAPSMLPGDGMGRVESFDPATRTVIVGQRPVPLLPAVAASLQQQLSAAGRPPNLPFMAKFSVGLDASGQSVIKGIYVMPRKQQ
jgi:hypothetical protein